MLTYVAINKKCCLACRIQLQNWLSERAVSSAIIGTVRIRNSPGSLWDTIAIIATSQHSQGCVWSMGRGCSKCLPSRRTYSFTPFLLVPPVSVMNGQSPIPIWNWAARDPGIWFQLQPHHPWRCRRRRWEWVMRALNHGQYSGGCKGRGWLQNKESQRTRLGETGGRGSGVSEWQTGKRKWMLRGRSGQILALEWGKGWQWARERGEVDYSLIMLQWIE